MRVASIVLVAFVVIYVAVTAIGAQRHSTERTPTKNDPPPLTLNLNWNLVLSFLKISTSDVVLFGTSAGFRTVAIAPAGSASLNIRSSSKQYRMMRLRLASGVQVGLSYPPPQDVTSSKAPEPLSLSKPQQTLVLSQSGGVVSLNCDGPVSCVVQY